MALFFKSLIGRVILLNILLLAIGFATYTLFHIRREQVHLIDTSRENAQLLASTIEKALFTSMSTGNSKDVQSIIEMVGRNPRLDSVRIFHPDGTILKSSKPEEIGQKVNVQDHTLFLSNRVEGTFRLDGKEILGVVKPIATDRHVMRKLRMPPTLLPGQWPPGAGSLKSPPGGRCAGRTHSRHTAPSSRSRPPQHCTRFVVPPSTGSWVQAPVTCGLRL